MERRNISADANGFVPARLTLARMARGFKQNELSELINRTPSTLSKWESVEYELSPDQEAINRLADILSVQPQWFFKPSGNKGVAFYRSLRSELGIARDKAAAKLHFSYDLYGTLADRVQFPDIDVPDLAEGRDYRTFRREDIDHFANRLRDYWGLGDDPIEDLLLVIENAGVAIAESYIDSEKLDGVSCWFDSQPVMLLAKDKSAGVRRRFDAAHELGHLVLHRNVSEEELSNNLNLIEEQAMAFAASFLLPEITFRDSIRSTSLEDLADVKPIWKTSIGAMIKRSTDLELITPEHARNLWKYYSYRKWRGNEPYDDRLPIERPLNMKTAIEMLSEDGAAEIRELMADVAMVADDISDLTGIALEKLQSDSQRGPKLRLVKNERISTGDTPKAAND